VPPILSNNQQRKDLISDQIFLTEMDIALKQMCEDVKLQKGLKDHLVAADDRFHEEKMAEYKSNAELVAERLRAKRQRERSQNKADIEHLVTVAA
jgi:hypothetical protein